MSQQAYACQHAPLSCCFRKRHGAGGKTLILLRYLNGVMECDWYAKQALGYLNGDTVIPAPHNCRRTGSTQLCCPESAPCSSGSKSHASQNHLRTKPLKTPFWTHTREAIWKDTPVLRSLLSAVPPALWGLPCITPTPEVRLWKERPGLTLWHSHLCLFAHLISRHNTRSAAQRDNLLHHTSRRRQ